MVVRVALFIEKNLPGISVFIILSKFTLYFFAIVHKDYSKIIEIDCDVYLIYDHSILNCLGLVYTYIYIYTYRILPEDKTGNTDRLG